LLAFRRKSGVLRACRDSALQRQQRNQESETHGESSDAAKPRQPAAKHKPFKNVLSRRIVKSFREVQGLALDFIFECLANAYRES
jgi:hypothetical protein